MHPPTGGDFFGFPEVPNVPEGHSWGGIEGAPPRQLGIPYRLLYGNFPQQQCTCCVSCVKKLFLFPKSKFKHISSAKWGTDLIAYFSCFYFAVT